MKTMVIESGFCTIDVVIIVLLCFNLISFLTIVIRHGQSVCDKIWSTVLFVFSGLIMCSTPFICSLLYVI